GPRELFPPDAEQPRAQGASPCGGRTLDRPGPRGMPDPDAVRAGAGAGQALSSSPGYPREDSEKVAQEARATRGAWSVDEARGGGAGSIGDPRGRDAIQLLRGAVVLRRRSRADPSGVLHDTALFHQGFRRGAGLRGPPGQE
ncbi:unnamed protein product, partial [Ectocarpus sp. 8 AP-2014]